METIKFKAGDIIKPLPGRRTSLEWNLSKLKKAEVLRIYDSYNSNPTITIKILEGSCSHSWSSPRKKGNTLDVTTKPFELFESTENYEIY